MQPEVSPLVGIKRIAGLSHSKLALLFGPRNKEREVDVPSR